MVLFTLFILFVISFTCLLGYITGFKRPFNFPPGPNWLPIVGNSSLIKSLSIKHSGLHNAVEKLSKDYKTNILGLKLGANLFVIVSSKELLKQVLTRDEFQARPDSYFIRLRTMGKRRGISMTDGTLWKEQRKFVVQHLHSLGFGKSTMESLIIEELEDFIKILDSRENEEPLDLKKYLAPCVMNVLWALTAGCRFNSGDYQLTRLLELMDKRGKAFDIAGGILNQLPFMRHFAPNWSGYNLICSLNQELRAMLEETVKDHKETLNESKTRDFIDAFLHEMRSKNGQNTTFTEEQLIMVCLDLFIGGSQTTSNTLHFALLHMILYQDVQDKVFKEIKEVLGDRKLPFLNDRPNLPYLVAVLLESQRCLHVIPLIGPRRVLWDTQLEKFTIPKGTTILMNLHSINHDEELWENPYTFMPERFLDSKNKQLISELHYFGMGKRSCIGEVLAKNFIFLFFVGILRNFHLKCPAGLDPPTLKPFPGITLSPEPYRVQFFPR